MLHVQNLVDPNVDNLNFLEFLVMSLTVRSLGLSMPLLKQFKEYYKDKIEKHVKTIKFPVEKYTNAKGVMINRFDLQNLYKKLLTCFFTWCLHGPDSRLT